jgi:hypothetical protein
MTSPIAARPGKPQGRKQKTELAAHRRRRVDDGPRTSQGVSGFRVVGIDSRTLVRQANRSSNGAPLRANA